MACYAPDAVLESPVVAHIEGLPGVCCGHEQLRPFHVQVVARTPEVPSITGRASLLNSAARPWEYPRESPDGEQMDFVEVMEIEDGLIQAHRVYWGWKGVDVLFQDQYHRS